MGSSDKRFMSGWVIPALLILLVIYTWNGHSKINRLRRDVRKLKNASVRLTPRSVRLTPGLDGYQVIRHDLGSATLILKEVKGHATGSVIILEIGNPTSVNITGATMTISYPVEWVEHSYQYDLQQTLVAGKATKARLILEGVKPSGLSYVNVSDLQPKGIKLIQAN